MHAIMQKYNNAVWRSLPHVCAIQRRRNTNEKCDALTVQLFVLHYVTFYIQNNGEKTLNVHGPGLTKLEHNHNSTQILITLF